MLDIKALLTKVINRLYYGNMFKVTTETSAQINTAANSNADAYITCTNAGYYPIGVVGYYCIWVSGQTALLNIYVIDIDNIAEGSCRVHCAARNMYSGQTQWKLQAKVLWVKV